MTATVTPAGDEIEADRQTTQVSVLTRVPLWTRALLGGFLTTLTVPPFGWWPLVIPGVALLATAYRPASRRRTRFGLTFLWAAALYVPSLWWMTAFSLPGGIFVGLLEAGITAVAATVLVPRRSSPVRVRFGLISALMIGDSARSLWPFGGLPLGGIDLGQANGWFAPVVGWLGRLGLVGLVAATSLCALTIIEHVAVRGGWRGLRGVGDVRVPAGLLACCVLLPGVVSLSRSPGTPPDNPGAKSVMVVQGGGPRGLLASADNARRTFEAHVQATKDALADSNIPVALVLWPENTVDSETFATSTRYQQIQQLTGTFLSVGITEDGGPTEFLNAQVMIGPDGQLVDRYDKARRVPFGEYFPLRKQIEGLGLADLPSRDARPGTAPGTLSANGVTYGVLISYEGFFDDRSRGAVNAGAEVLLIPTNASSYRTTQLPSQQVAAAQLRALETNRDVFQAGPTGYSGFITADGTVQRLSRLGERSVFAAVYTPHHDRTPYVRFNDVPALLIAGAFAALARLRRTGLSAPR